MVEPLKKGDACGKPLLDTIGGIEGNYNKEDFKKCLRCATAGDTTLQKREVEAEVKSLEPHTTKESAKKKRKSRPAKPTNWP